MPCLPDWISGFRLLVVPPVVWLALSGNGRLVGAALILAGLTDFLDGYLARRLDQQSAHGAWLDSLADSLLLIAAAASLEILHPRILRENTGLIAATFVLFAASLIVGLIKFRKLGNLHLYSSKVAGGLLYSFALLTLFMGAYEPLLLATAVAALIFSSAETLLGQLLASSVNEEMGSVLLARRRRAEVTTTHDMGSASMPRSQTPQPLNVVVNNAAPIASITSSAAPITTEITP
jgi:phosphatidylglycerophosphate synthase